MADQNKKQSGGFNPIGLCLGMGVGLCFSVALGHRSSSNDKSEEKTEEEHKE